MEYAMPTPVNDLSSWKCFDLTFRSENPSHKSWGFQAPWNSRIKQCAGYL